MEVLAVMSKDKDMSSSEAVQLKSVATSVRTMASKLESHLLTVCNIQGECSASVCTI